MKLKMYVNFYKYSFIKHLLYIHSRMRNPFLMFVLIVPVVYDSVVAGKDMEIMQNIQILSPLKTNKN